MTRQRTKQLSQKIRRKMSKHPGSHRKKKKEEEKALGSEFAEKSMIEQHKEEREKMEKVRDDLKKENDRAEKIIADAELEGKGFSGIKKNKPERLTDVEYAEALDKGEVNALKEDGIEP